MMSNIIETAYNFDIKLKKLVIDECDESSQLGLSFAFAEQTNLGEELLVTYSRGAFVINTRRF